MKIEWGRLTKRLANTCKHCGKRKKARCAFLQAGLWQEYLVGCIEGFPARITATE
jgi:hypothetical protein